ncbi:MAG: hypothetical protein IPH07_23515 [Deltaproteobacteria bacterium]|nr:hypothetical protein [Deltaproteobacteria bacterium]
MAVKVRTADGAVTTVSAKQAQEGALRGDLQILDRSVRVKLGNRTGTISSADLTKATAKGWAIVDDEEAEELRLEREQSTLGNKALAVGEQVASDLTLGGTRLLEESLGVDPKAMAARNKAAGVAADIAGVGAQIAAGVLSGGASAAVEAGAAAGAKAAGKGLVARTLAKTPAGMAVRAGEKVAARVLPGATGLKKAIPLATGQFVEGIGYGAGAEIDESVLGQRDIAVEQIAAAGVMQGILGGTLGLAGEGLAKVAASRKKVRATDVEEVFQRGIGNTDEVVHTPPGRIAKVLAAGTGADSADVQRMVDMSNSPAMRDLVLASPADIARKTSDEAAGLRPHFDDLDDAVGEALKNTEGRYFAKSMKLREGADLHAHAVADDAVANALRQLGGEDAYAAGALDDAARAADEFAGMRPQRIQREAVDDLQRALEKDPEAAGAFADAGYPTEVPRPHATDAEGLTLPKTSRPTIGQTMEDFGPAAANANGFIKMARREVEGVRELIATSKLNGKGAVEVVQAVDVAQRRLRDIESKLHKLVTKSEPEYAAIDALRAARKELKAFVYNKDLLGDAAAKLQTADALQAAAMKARVDAGNIDPTLKKIFNRDKDITPDSLLSVMRKFGRGRGTEDAIGQVFETELAYLRHLRDNYDMPSGFADQVAKAEAAFDGMKSAVAKRGRMLDDLDVVARVRAAESGNSVSLGGGSNAGTMAGAAIGGMIAGVPGATVGGIAGRVATHAYTSIRAYAALRNLIDKSGLHIDGAVGRLLHGMRGGGKAAAGAVGRGIAKGTTRVPQAVTSISSKSRAERETEAARIRDRAALLASNPDVLIREMSLPLRSVDQHAPRIYDGITELSARAAAFLQSKIPTGYSPQFSTNPPVVNPVEQAKWEKYVQAVTDPLATIDLMAEGRLTVEHVEALKEVYPQIYRNIVSSVMDELADAQDSKRMVPYRERIQLGVILGIPTDAALQPDHLAQLQAVFAAPDAPPPGQGIPLPPTSETKNLKGKNKFTFPSLAPTPTSKTEI